jgi:glycosyltransferase involved in cell wall biosynthesis
MKASAEPVRVLYLSPVGERGGAEVVLLNILKHHDRSRFTPMVCFLKEGPLAAEVRGLGIKCFLVPAGRFRHLSGTLRAMRAIRRLVKEERVDLIFSNMAMGHLYGGLAALGTPAKRVWFQHTISSGQTVDRLAAIIPADRLYVNSQASLEAVHELRHLAKRVQVVYPGVDTSAHALVGDRFLFRREFDIPDDAFLVAMVARFQRWKGHHVFIAAAAAVCRQEPKARFVIVGDTLLGVEPDYKAELAQQVMRCGLSGSVIFAGWRNDVPALLSEVDVLAHPPILPEPFGLVVVEALLHGKPVVASRQGGLTEILTDGATGFLVAPGDAKALAEQILVLLRDESLRRRMGERGRETVLERFTIARMIAELEQSYFEVLGATASDTTSVRVKLTPMS